MRITIEKTYDRTRRSSFEIKSDNVKFGDLLNSFIAAAKNFGYSEEEIVSFITEDVYEKIRKGSK